MKKLTLFLLAVVTTVSLVACGNEETEPKQDNTPVVTQAPTPEPTPEVVTTPEPEEVEATESGDMEMTESGEFVNVPKSQQIGTAGSGMPLKDNQPEAELQIKKAMQDLLVEAYGDEVFDARIYVEKIYTAEEEEENEALKEMNLGANEVAFEVKYELRPAAGVEDIMKFTAGTGEYDEETGWVKEKYNLGVLRPNESGDGYVITNFGTGW